MDLNTLKSKLTTDGKKMSKPVKWLIYLLILLLVIGASYLVFDRMGYIRAFQLGMQMQKQQAQQEADKVVLDSLKKIMLLPEDSTPTMAIINNADMLKKQQASFFGKAKNGDRLIVYPTMAIIYDYTANKIIQVGPVQVEVPQTQQKVDNK